MTQHAATSQAVAPGRPVLVIVDADQQARTATQSALVRRFGADYQVMGADSVHPDASRALLVPMDQHGARIPFGELPALQRATALGRIDCWILKGWVTPEEW